MPFQDARRRAEEEFEDALDAVLDNLHADAATFEACVKTVWNAIPPYVKALQEAVGGATELQGEAYRAEAEKMPLTTTQFLIRLREHRERRGL